MATKKGGGGGPINGRIVAGGIAVAIISSVSSFAAIRFALPKQMIIKEVQIIQTPAPDKKADDQGDLWTLTDPFIVNLADPEPHFLKVNVSLEISKPANAQPAKGGGEGGASDPGKAVIARMKPVEPVYRDAIISTLRQQTMQSLQDLDRVKSELKVNLNLLNEQDPTTYPKTLQVYFSDFAVQ
ncbi:MAG: flagellar basal body-associated FliL family protein [Cyanobacteria bacterium REEB65]|nr:flagellar basal body-associated FliL family protein [Cyanobacteria bacterium REEB65]